MAVSLSREGCGRESGGLFHPDTFLAHIVYWLGGVDFSARIDGKGPKTAGASAVFGRLDRLCYVSRYFQ